MAKPVAGYDDIKRVATISVESEQYGTMIADMFDTVGENGYVYVEFDYGFDVKTKIIDGFQIEAGLPSVDYSVQGSYSTELGLSNILVSNHEVTVEHVQKVYAQLAGRGVPAVVWLAHSFTEEASASIAHLFKAALSNDSKEKSLTPVIPITMPVTYREIILRDIAKLSGSTLFDGTMDAFTITDLGQPFKKILLKKNNTYFVGAPNDVDVYVKDLVSQKDDMSDTDKERMDKRIARLTGSVGTIKVGGQTDAERKYLYHKVKDAVNATRSAVKHGVVAGGGIALKEVGKNLDFEPLSYPHKVIEDNLGEKFEGSIDVLDSVAVVQNSLQKAVSAASQVLRIKYVIANRNLTVEEETQLGI